MSGVAAWLRWQWPYAASCGFAAPFNALNRLLLRRPIPGIGSELPARWVKDKWGALPAKVRAFAAADPAAWVNMNSGGEVLMAQPVLDRLKAERGGWLLSTESYDTLALLQRRYGEERVLFPPWDMAAPARAALGQLRPRALIFVLNAYFPVLLRQAKRAGVKTILINGLLSRNVAQANPFMRRALGLGFARFLDALAVQSEADAEAFRELGVPGERITVTGNVAGDLAAFRIKHEERARQRRALGFADADSVLVIGSAHAKEQGVVLDAVRRLRARVPQAKFLVAPRWAHEARGMAETFSRENLSVALKSEAAAAPGRPNDVVVVDTFGELRTLYGLGDAAYIGATLVPINERRAGHNPLEPLAHGVVPVFGPHMNLWRHATQALQQAWPALEVDSAETLSARVEAIFKGAAPVAAIREVGFRLVEASGGAVDRTVAFLQKELVRA